MNNPSTDRPVSRRLFPAFFVGTVLCWLLVIFLHLYFFAYASMDSWCYAAPAAMARVPFELTTPFLGAFEGADRAWGLHWPGGLLFTSIFTPFLPHTPATYISIYMFYWLMASLATAALVRRLTSSSWMALAGFLLVATDRSCFGVTWLQRYELLGGAIATAALLAVCSREDLRPGLRAVVIGGAFFFFPLLHPVFSGLGFGWLVYLGFRTLVLRQSWKRFCVAAASYAAGWAAFLAYYRSRPWLNAEFISHAQVNLAITQAAAPPGIRTFLRGLLEIDLPLRAGTILYSAALCGALWLLFSAWKSRADFKQWLAREDMAIFASLGLVGTLFLSQFTYNRVYWASAWPFAAAVACYVAYRLAQSFPRQGRLVIGAFALLLLLHAAYLPGRTYLWKKTGFANLRGQIRDFASALPPGGQLFIPESLWDTYADGHRTVFMNALPYLAGDPAEQRYASFIGPRMHSGDVFVIDQLQSHVPLIDPHQPGWKQIGHSKLVYQGDRLRGFDLTAYQKQ